MKEHMYFYKIQLPRERTVLHGIMPRSGSSLNDDFEDDEFRNSSFSY
jgi:hypothetical protein